MLRRFEGKGFALDELVLMNFELNFIWKVSTHSTVTEARVLRGTKS